MPDVTVNGLMLDYPHSGTAVYTSSLMKHLPEVAPDFHFRLLLRQSANVFDVDSRSLSTPFRLLNRGRGIAARLDKVVWEVAALPLETAMTRQDLIHFPYFAAPPFAAAPVIVTVHDLIPLVLPGYHRGYQSALYSRFMSTTVKRSAAILTVSEHSRGDIVERLDVPEGKVFAIHEALDYRFQADSSTQSSILPQVRDRYHLPDQFFLYLGSSERRKNLENLIRAWKRVADHMRKREIGLVIVARLPPPDGLYPDLYGLAQDLGLGDDIVFVPEVSDTDKPAIYQASLAFCFPSTYEGFGFPPLEAMASGIPVISSNASSLPEVVGDAGLLLDPGNLEDWSEALILLADHESLRRRLGDRGRARAQTFSWERTARQTVEVYQEVLNR